MPSHSNNAIMKMINGSTELTAKWHELTMQMTQNLHEEFYAEMGVPVPTLPMCNPGAFQTDQSAQFSTEASVDEYTNGLAGIIGASFEENWSDVALQATNLVGTIASKIIGSGEIKTGITGMGNSITTKPKDGKKERTFLVAAYANNEACAASDWGTKETFYASTYVFAIWPPAPAAMELAEANRHKWSKV